MSELKWKIQHEYEGSKLDFKKTPYVKENYHELLKDIMSMANVLTNEKRYIVIGVKEHPDSTKEYFSIPKEKIVDQATFQQIVRDNIEPTIDFSYYPIELEDNTLGIIEIKNCEDAPYMMKKDYSPSLKKGDCFIRKGSQIEKLTRRDLDEILEFKKGKIFKEKILFGFGENLELKLTVNGVRNLELPSQIAEKEINSILKIRKEKVIKESLKNDSEANKFEKLMNTLEKFKEPYYIDPYRNRSTEQLQKDLENIKEIYEDYDLYYICEEKAEKVNLVLKNNANEYLNDASVEIQVPINSALVMEDIYEKPNNDYSQTRVLNVEKYLYPRVEKKSDKYIVKQDIKVVKHHQFTNVFDSDLRVFFSDKQIGKTFNWSFTIYAKNLPNPIKGSLIIEVV